MPHILHCHLILMCTLEIIPILQMSKLMPKEEAHSQLPKAHQLRTRIITKATLQRISPALSEVGFLFFVAINANVSTLFAGAWHQYQLFT